MDNPAAEQDPILEEDMSDEDFFAAEVERREKGLMDDPDPAAEPVVAAEEEEELAGDEPEGDEPAAAAPQVEEEPAPTKPVVKDPARTAVQQVRPEWYTSLDDKAKGDYDKMTAELDKFRQDYAAVTGRLAPVQQENAWLRGQLQAYQSRGKASDPSTGGQPSPAVTPEKDLQNSKEFQEFAEAFPDEARAIEALVGAKTNHISQLEDKLNRLEQGLNTVQQTTTAATQAQELGALEHAHPDWQQVRYSADFGDWLQFQPATVQQMVNSSRAQDCIYVLDTYKRDVYIRDTQRQPQPSAPAVDPAAQQAAGRRQVRRNAPPSPPPSRGGVGVPGGNQPPQMSDEDVFAAEAARRARSRVA